MYRVLSAYSSPKPKPDLAQSVRTRRGGGCAKTITHVVRRARQRKVTPDLGWPV